MSRNVQTDQKGHRQLPMFESCDRSRSSESTRGGLHSGLAFVCFDSIYTILYFEYVWMVCWTYHSRAVGYSKSKWLHLGAPHRSVPKSKPLMTQDVRWSPKKFMSCCWTQVGTRWKKLDFGTNHLCLITRWLDTCISYLNWAGRFLLQILELNLSWMR